MFWIPMRRNIWIPVVFATITWQSSGWQEVFQMANSIGSKFLICIVLHETWKTKVRFTNMERVAKSSKFYLFFSCWIRIKLHVLICFEYIRNDIYMYCSRDLWWKNFDLNHTFHREGRVTPTESRYDIEMILICRDYFV